MERRWVNDPDAVGAGGLFMTAMVKAGEEAATNGAVAEGISLDSFEADRIVLRRRFEDVFEACDTESQV